MDARVKPAHDDRAYPDLASAPSIMATEFARP
jgi:hypothetical protein